MRLPSVRLPVVLGFLAAGSLFLALPPARADLVWNATGGWTIEGGALSGLTGEEGRNALDLMNKARASEEKGSLRRAGKTYEEVARKYPNSIYSPEALYRAGKVFLAHKEYYRSFQDFQGVLDRYPNTKRFNEIIGEEYHIASALLDGAHSRFFFGMFPGFASRERALGYFEVVLANAPYSDYAPLALMNIANGHQKFSNIPEGIDALDRMINYYPQSLLTPDAYLKLGQINAALVDGPEYDQAATRDAITYFEDFMILFPGDPNVPLAEKGLADMKTVLAESKIKMADFYFYKRDNYTAARVFYNEAITDYPDSPIAAVAKKRLEQVEAKAAGKPAPADTPAPEGVKKKKRFWLF
ncbi:MAG TPA: outer membrane protein assembly factor BamD [Opitutaceae bacterium]|nr:outer membrane protein assembly factor BamD [Opitutaceae bacterium]